ncbi:MAG TPA: hypothetical protein VEG38_01525 [Acidimicrobiia bacterium]|nr:hypothetical protein [Acidimicrobiia bacterium]
METAVRDRGRRLARAWHAAMIERGPDVPGTEPIVAELALELGDRVYVFECAYRRDAESEEVLFREGKPATTAYLQQYATAR